MIEAEYRELQNAQDALCDALDAEMDTISRQRIIDALDCITRATIKYQSKKPIEPHKIPKGMSTTIGRIK